MKSDERIYRENLQTCPFCNRKVGISKVYRYGHVNGYMILCDCGIETKVYSTIQALTNYWNRRKGENA